MINKTDPNRIYSGATPDEVFKALEPLVDFQDEGIPLPLLKEKLEDILIPHLMKYDHPGFHSLFNFFIEKGAELGAQMALKYNQGVTNWQVSPGGAALEELCCQALCRLFGLSETADATFMFSGTYANQQALFLALHRYAERCGFDLSQKGLKGFQDVSRLRVLASKEAHFSLKHAVRILGLGEESLRLLDVDMDRRLRLESLKELVKEIRMTHHEEVFCVVATAGTTSTGTIDPIRPISEICGEMGSWFHVDGAYGLAYSLIPEMAPLYSGLEGVDSITWDPHKQFGVPIPSSILFLKNRADFSRMAIFGEYFNRREGSQPNPGLKSPPTTRPLAALPLVTNLLHLGKTGMIHRLRAPILAVRELEKQMRNLPEIEVVHPPDTGILCYRIVPRGVGEADLNALQEKVYEKIQCGGTRSLSMTKLDGKSVLRLVALTAVVVTDDLMETVRESLVISREFVRSQKGGDV
ncbi:pyridoxal phosphate-dependent decarboxylase family protein [Acidobacteriota bacterium]